jgi:lipoprotein-releasing system permease protein
MNLAFYIANRIRKGEISGKRLAGPVVKVATLGVALGMAVMILSVAIGFGFKKEVREKVIGFGGHIQVMSYDYNLSYEVNPIRHDSALYKLLTEVSGVQHVQKFITKPGIIKTRSQVHGIVLKGVSFDFDWHFFQNILQEGTVLSLSNDSVSNQILISRTVANMLNLKVGDAVPMYFLEQQLRARKFVVTGIFDSSLPEFDELFALVDFRQVQKLNNWNENQIAGYEVLVSDFDNLKNIGADVKMVTASYIDPDGLMLRTRTIQEAQPQIFGWLDLLDTNIAVILILIMLVAGFNMISGLLILILERTNMIGILKAVGADNQLLRRVFVYLAVFIIGRGLILGNLIGLGLCYLQKYTGIIKLDPTNYYLDSVPILINPVHVLLLNLAALVITTIMLVGPSYLVGRISPAKAIRFD